MREYIPCEGCTIDCYNFQMQECKNIRASVTIESQVVDTEGEMIELYDKLLKAKKDGVQTVQDYWGHNACDTYTIDEALEKFKYIAP